jgi:hypothetical protein
LASEVFVVDSHKGQPGQHSLDAAPYEAATAALREDTQQWWADTLAHDPAELEEDEEPFTADAEGLRRFLEGEVLPWFEARKKELANRPLIREQAFGESLDPDKLERLGRYEGPSRPKARTDAGHVAAPQGPAARDDRGLIRFAKPMAVVMCTSREDFSRAYAARGSLIAR